MTNTASMSLFRNATDFEMFEPGQVIFEEGQPGDYMCAVLEGEVEISREGKTVEVLGPDGLFGELALIDNSNRAATARARTAVKLVKVDQKRFVFMVQNNPYFALHVMHLLAERLRNQRPA